MGIAFRLWERTLTVVCAPGWTQTDLDVVGAVSIDEVYVLCSSDVTLDVLAVGRINTFDDNTLAQTCGYYKARPRVFASTVSPGFADVPVPRGISAFSDRSDQQLGIKTSTSCTLTVTVKGRQP